MNPFYAQVYTLVKKVPQGKVISYGQIAKMLGRPRSAREVGRAMRICPESDNIPWQRVVMSDGTITGGQFADMRKGMLEDEGVTFLADGRVDMKACAVKELQVDDDLPPFDLP
ncbi:MAG: MGMT family protein [Defluviitaleaceae bacterium]|nr:MGMT family protein [Defluviitaleaceae bacterium]